MKKYEYENFEVMINDDETKELMFDKYKIVQYKKKSKSIGKYGAYFYMVDTTKDFKSNRISAVFTQNKKLDEFYYDFYNDKEYVNKFLKGTIEQEGPDEYRLIIDELGRREYEEIKKNLREIVKGALNG